MNWTPHPGSLPPTRDLQAQLEAALAALPPNHAPRTRHYAGADRRSQGTAATHDSPYAPAGAQPTYTNLLILQTSPYLRQHAHNPVDWRPWGPEAFDEARELNRPVFLSVGYATCHWCHVMEHESFEDLDVARVLNERYVPIKVDREERPDVDAVHMAAVHAMQGHGGWPMNVWLAPLPTEAGGGAVGLPFFAGTYFAPRDGMRGQTRGLHEVATQLADLYAQDPDRVFGHGWQVAAAVRQQLSGDEPGELVGTQATDAVVDELKRDFDAVSGGRRRAPKFPSQIPVQALLRHNWRTGDAQSLHMAVFTLQQMAAGGLYDHVGGGFHRYSTDARWRVPHFEKMLYDQGLIVLAAVDAWQVVRDPDLALVVRETLDYLLRELRHPDGAFHSATDADSEGREGAYFVWTLAELQDVLGPDEAAVLADVYDASPQGHFEGANVLHRRTPWLEAAARHGVSVDDLQRRTRASLDRLYERRQTREPPLRDDKILMSWNGLAISALARAGRVFDEPRWALAGEQAAHFLLDRLQQDGRLLRSWLDGPSRTWAFLDDYAFLIQALLDLFEATSTVQWLRAALELQATQDRHHWDPERGGYFATPDDGEHGLVRVRPDQDGAEPCGNSVAALNLVRLAALTGDERWHQRARQTLQAFGERLADMPGALAEMLLAVEAWHAPMQEVVLVWPKGSDRSTLEPFLTALRDTFAPHRVVMMAQEGEGIRALAEVAPPVAERVALHGLATAYVCRQGACELPTVDPRELVQQLWRGRRPDENVRER